MHFVCILMCHLVKALKSGKNFNIDRNFVLYFVVFVKAVLINLVLNIYENAIRLAYFQITEIFFKNFLFLSYSFL